MTLDGFCDHTAITPDEEIHEHYTQLLQNAGSILYGRITFQLMEYWRPILTNPTGKKSIDEFAVTINRIPKIVFSRTMDHVDWESATLAKRNLREEVLALKQRGNGENKDILVGSRSLIISLLEMNLIDEFQLCIHPVVAGNGLPLFENISGRTIFKLEKTKTFGSGAVLFYYQPAMTSKQ